MKTRFIAILAIACAATGARILAHHSFAAQYDPTKAIRIQGVLSKVEWTNPHTYFYVDVKEENGQTATWGCEGAAAGSLSRRGFKRGDVKIGEILIIDGYRARDGSRLMDARRMTLPDGRIVAGGSPGDGGPQ
jgi:hypothetical protein